METFVPKRLSRTSLFILAMGTAAAAQFLLLRAAIRSISHSSGDEPDEHQAPASPARRARSGLGVIHTRPSLTTAAGDAGAWCGSSGSSPDECDIDRIAARRSRN